MGAKIQDWINSNIWDFSKRSDYDLKGTIARETIFGGFDNFSDEKVTEERAGRITTVYNCLNVRAQTIASLPINVFKTDKEGNTNSLTDHPAYYPLAHQPNNYMTSANLMMTSMFHSDRYGNSVIAIHRDGFMRPEKFEIIKPGDWDVRLVDGDAFYKINGLVYSSNDVLHFRWLSEDGLIGISPIRYNMNTMGKAVKLERYSTYAIGKKPPGILTYERDMREEAMKQNQKNWQQDLENGKTPVLSGAWKFQPVMMTPDEAQYIQSEGMTDQKIAAIFRIPPIFLQDYARATWKNSEESDLIFAKHTITPIIRVIEQECNMKLFTEREKKNTFIKFNINGLLRGDLAARQAFYQSMVNSGIMTRNEARNLEDMNDYEGGDDALVQGAMIPADMLREHYESQVLPTVPKQKSHLNGHEILN